jgi:hypothetical protein
MAKEPEVYVGKEGAQELYRRIKAEIGKFSAYQKADPEGTDRHPAVSDPSTKIIYLVEVAGTPDPDHYKEWIWAQPEGQEGNWVCIGDTSMNDNSWKQWSEDNGSTSSSDESVYVGQNNSIERDDTYVIGQANTVTVTDETDYSGTDVVEIGSENTATDAANTYQLGKENTVTGNNLANKEQYPHSMAMNLGRNNTITGEGVNIGKDNVSSTFGVTVGQRNQATDASIAIGEDVDSYRGSISIGHGKPSSGSTMLSMLAMSVNGEEIPAQKVKLDLTEYTYYESAAVFKTASNTYEWGEINDFSTRIVIFVNETLNTYLVGGNTCTYETVTGYFDENGSFISSTDPEHDAKTYRRIFSTNDVSLNPLFYCSMHPNDGTMVQVPGYVRKTDTQPATGTVLDSAGFAELSARMSINDNSYDNINVHTDDLSAPAMKCYYGGTNRPFYTQYSVYGYRDDNNNFIPYNDVTKYKSNAFTWETIPADELHTSVLDPAVVGYETPKTISRNDSIAIGKSMEADTSSFGIGIGTLYPQVMYERESDAGGWIGYTDTRYKTLTISQVDGSVAQSGWITYNRVWFNSKVDDVSWSASAPSRTVMGNSIAIVNTGSSSSYNNYLSGASVGIGNGLKLTDNSFGFGTNIEGDNNSVLVGANLTAQVGGSTLVGRDIAVKIGDSDNDGGSINGEYDGGLVAFGMSIAPSPGSVTVGRSGVTTGRGSIAVGASGISATRGSVVYGRNGVSAEGRATAIGTDGISAKNASITVGLDSISAEDGSAAFGTGGISAYSGSISIGRNGNSARSGSMALGFSNQAESGSTSVGAQSVARSGAFTFGRGMTAESAGISIGTTGGNQAAGGRSAQGGIVKYKNPDNIYVPIKGSIRVKSGYSIDHVRVFRNVSYDGTTYDYAVLGIDSGYYNSNSTVYLYKNGTEVTSVYRTDIRNAFSTASEEYWRIKNGSAYSFVRFVAEKTYNELGNLKNLKEYLEINPRTFTQNEQVYVYADGFNYPTTGLTYNNWIPLSSCTFDVYDYWTGVMLGYGADAWNRLTASGGYNKGIAIGANAHAEGCSFAMAPNYDVMGSSSTVSIGNRLNASSNGLPTSLDYDIYYNGNSISANGYSAAIGLESITATGHSFALGNQSLRAYGHSTAIGTDGVYADRYSLSIGCKTNDAYNYSFAIGQNSNFATGYSFAIGNNSNTASGYSLAIGTNSNQARDYSLAIGDGNNAETYSSVFGYNSKAYHNSIVLGKYASAFDYSTSIGINTGAYNYSTAIGDGIGAYDNSFGVGRWGTVKNYSVSLGDSNYVDYYSLAMGRSNDSDNRSVAIGDNNRSSQYAVAMGRENTARGENVAIGIRNSVNNDSYSGSHGIAIGEGNTSRYGGYNIAFGLNNAASREAISIGTGNSVTGWSIGLGIRNNSTDDSGAHSTLIGYNNNSTSNLEKLEKSIRVKYEKQEALEKEIARYNTVHNKALALVRDYTSSSEYTTYANYEQALYDYYVNGGPNPGYNQSYYDIKNSLVNYPAIIMSSTDWDNWYNGYNYGYYYMAEACDYYQYYIWYQDDYYLDYYKEYRDYAYQYLPAWLDLMKTYAANNMTDDYVATLTEIIDAIADRPEIVPMDIFYTGTSGYYQSDYYKLVGEFYESYNSRSYATQGRMPNKLQYDYRDYDSESTSLRLIIQNIIRSGSSGVYIDEVEEIPCNSILMGSGNESRHYNSILIGANNRSAAPTSEKAKTDDDGFTLAVGYRNTVGRNYDIAIGYMSEANGGENVAIQHSTAGNGKQSYHNLAMFDSKAYGTGNVALQHAEVKSGYRNLAMFDSTIDAGVLNIVHGNSKLVCTGDGNINNFVLAESTFTGTGGSGGNYIQYNSLFNSEISTSGAMFFSRFFRTNGIVEGGGNGAANSEYFANKDLQLISNSADRNLLFGNISAGLRASSIARNLFFGNDNRYGALGLNATTISDCIISTMHALQFSTGAFTDNVLLDSRLLGNASDFTTNVLLGRSIAELQWTEGLGMPVTYNFLFNARLNLTNHYCSQTVLFDCVASNVYDSFAFGFGDTAEEGLSQGLYDSSRMVTFGDGIIRNSSDTFHFGANNEITSVYDSTVFGRMNTIYGSDIGGATSLGSLRLLGSSNTVNGYAITNTIIGNTNSIYGTSILNHCGADNNIILGNANGIYAQYMVSGNTIIGGGNYITGVTPDVTLIDSAAELNSIDHACMVKVIHDSAVPTGESYTYISSEAYYYYSNGTLTRFYTWTTGLTDVIKATAIVMTGSSLASAFNAGTLQEFTWYYSTSSQSNVSIPEGEMLWNSSSYYYDGTTVTEMESGTNGRYIFRNAIIGDANVIHNNVAGFTVLGGNNTITYTAPRTLDDCISFGLVQGNNNTANDGSNIVCLGNGNRSTGHNSVAIGDQLVSNQWQTVIGKYNSPIEGPNRLDTENPQDASKALFIIGNGYSEKDDADWQKEEYITRSNAMVVYADGTVRAKKFVSDEPELELTAGTGITLTPDMSAGTNTVAVSQDLADFITFLASKPATGRYTINSVDGVLSWVQIGTTQV